MRARNYRSRTGITLVELTAAVVFGLPPIVLMVYAGLEANLLLTIRTSLDAATRRAAQALITDYVTTGVIAPDTSNGNLPTALAFDVRTGNGQYFINRAANQFTWTWDLSVRPATVTVTAKYPTNGNSTYGLVPFPSPDPMKLANKFSISTSATFPVPPGG